MVAVVTVGVEEEEEEEEVTEVEAAGTAVVAVEVMDGLVEIPTENADQPRLKKAKKSML